MAEPLTQSFTDSFGIPAEPDLTWPWFAVMVKSRHEKSVATMLSEKGYTEFLPLYKSRHRHAGRMRSVELPLFPTYTFCRFDPTRRLPILTIPGVFSIVGFGDRPAPVSESEIEALQAIVRSGVNVLACPFLRAGDRVLIEAGPLKGVEGFLVRDESRCRVVVAVSLLQRAVAAEVDRDSVRLLSRPAQSSAGPIPLRAPSAWVNTLRR